MTDLQPGRIFEARFRIVRRLGEGAFGIVYEAVDEPLQRTVALKVLKTSAADTDIRRRFLREGKILSTLRSDKLVRLYSVNVSSDGVLYMVMDLLEGETLRSKLNRSGALSEEFTLQIARSILLALSDLEAADVIHRDLKPDNIMLLNDSTESIRLLDFGLSGIVSKKIVNDSTVTAEGTMLGSIHYMSPECCTGRKATNKSDLYSLGCILYECLTGTPVFEAETPTAVAFKHATEMPETPHSEETPVSRFTESFILRLLQKDPANRYKNSADAIQSLEFKEAAFSTMPLKLLPYCSTVEKSHKASRARLLQCAFLLFIVCAISISLATRKSEQPTTLTTSQYDQKIHSLASALTEVPATGQWQSDSATVRTSIRTIGSGSVDYDNRMAKLFDLLASPESAQNRKLSPETVNALTLLIKMVSVHHVRTAQILAFKSLVFLQSPMVPFQTKVTLIEQLLTIGRSIAIEQTRADYTAISSIVNNAITINNDTDAKNAIDILLQLDTLRNQIGSELKDEALETKVIEVSKVAPLAVLRSLRPRIQDVLELHKQARDFSPSAKEYANILVKIDKNATDNNKTERLGNDYLALNEMCLEKDPKTARHYLDLALQCFETTKSPAQLVIATVNDARAKALAGDGDGAKKSMEKADKLAIQVKDHAQQQGTLFYLIQGWCQIHPNHSDLRTSCEVGQKLIQTVRRVDRSTNQDSEAFRLWITAYILHDHVPNRGLPEAQLSWDYAWKTPRVQAPHRLGSARAYAQSLLKCGKALEAASIYRMILSKPEFRPLVELENGAIYREAGRAEKASGYSANAKKVWDRYRGDKSSTEWAEIDR